MMSLVLFIFILLLVVTTGLNQTAKSPGNQDKPSPAKAKVHVKAPVAKIALATQGKAAEVVAWPSMLSIMTTKSQVVLFLLSYDVPIASNVCNNQTIVCLYKPGSTWTAGRNELARKIAEIQEKYKYHFKYWMMADQDLSKLYKCGEATRCQPPLYPALSTKLGACCFDEALMTLLAPEVQYAIVNYHIAGKVDKVSYVGFSHLDCADGSLNAFHHAAIPVILPYIELIDKVSWWESQGLQFHMIAGCFPGYSVYSNVFSINGTTSHAGYPHGRKPYEANKALRQVYGKLGLIPTPITVAKVQLSQTNCANLNHTKMGLVDTFEPKVIAKPGKAALKTVRKSDAWMNLTSFKRCLNALKPRYLKYIKTGNLTALDGVRFEPIPAVATNKTVAVNKTRSNV